MKYHVASLFTFFKKAFAICKVFTARCLDVRFWNLFYFIVWSSIHNIGIFFFGGRKCDDLVVIFNERWNFCGIFTKSQKLCLHKIFNIRSTTKVNFSIYTRCKTHITPILLKNYSFHNFLNRSSNFAFV